MEEAELLKFIVDQIDELKVWFLSTLRIREQRSDSVVQAAVNEVQTRWATEDLLFLWEAFSEDLLLTAGRARIAASGFLGKLAGSANPPWEPQEAGLVIGLVLLTAAEVLVKSPRPSDQIKATQLLGDAREAKAWWMHFRGATGARVPDSKIKGAEDAVAELEERVKKSDRQRDLVGRRHAPVNKARAWVWSEWTQHREAYQGNKSAFARDYVGRLRNEFGVDVKEKQLREVWLKDPPPTGKQAGPPVPGE